MRRLVSYVLPPVLLLIVVFLINIRPANAAWQRVGDTTQAFNVENICNDGFTVWFAVTGRYGQTEEEVIEIYENEPPLTVNIRAYQFAEMPNIDEFTEFPTDVVSKLVASGTITAQFTPEKIEITSPGEGSFSYFYGRSDIQFSEVLDFENYPFLYFLEAANTSGEVRRIAPITQSVPDCTSSQEPTPTLEFPGATPAAPTPVPSDGRLNAYDAASSAVIYCIDNDIQVYGVAKDSKGFLSFVVTQDEIETLGVPTENTLIRSGRSGYDPLIRLYRLSSGEFQINAPDLSGEADKEYTFIWNGC
jgi:hypothetical protein